MTREPTFFSSDPKVKKQRRNKAKHILPKKDLKMSKTSAAQQLATKILQLYNPKNNTDALVAELYSQDAIFNDPLVQVQGIENVQAQFRLLQPLVAETQATLIRGSINGNNLLMESQLTFSLYPLPKVMKITLMVFTVCTLDGDKICSHNDSWDIKSVIQSIPFVGYFYDKFRPVCGAVSSAVIKRVLPAKAIAVEKQD